MTKGITQANLTTERMQVEKPVDWGETPYLTCGPDIEYLMSELRIDPWLDRKTDRNRRLREHKAYLERMLPEMSAGEGLFVDLGPGPGESLELARSIGLSAVGIDSFTGTGGMGDSYLAYSVLSHIRQNLNVAYCGAWNIEEAVSDVRFLNSRGSIEQIMSPHMGGDPHHRHQNCRQLSWPRHTNEILTGFLSRCRRCMRDDGIMAIHANGARNDWVYSGTLPDSAYRAGFSRIETLGNLQHRLFA